MLHRACILLYTTLVERLAQRIYGGKHWMKLWVSFGVRFMQ
jgi:hypothetical protein